MSKKIIFRVDSDLAEWLAGIARRTGIPAGRIAADLLRKARSESGSQPFLRQAGRIDGPADLSEQEGFARPLR